MNSSPVGPWIAALLIGSVSAAECPTPGKPIDTDRPDVTNSSLVVPVGSFQDENGINLNALRIGRTIDGTNSRLRLGIGDCLEVLVDLPAYVHALRGDIPSGFGNAAPAIKGQVSPVPGEIDLSVVAGGAFPSGSRALRGRGLQPYVQFPWSVDIGGQWSVNGMETNFFTPRDERNKFASQWTFVLERELGERLFAFGEYVGDYPLHGPSSHQFNSGAGYRVTPTQQIDFHAAIGVNRAAPKYAFGIGYSLRWDKLF